MIKVYTLFIAFFLIGVNVFSQEHLSPLRYSGTYGTLEAQANERGISVPEYTDIYFEIDTLHLPFTDDFSVASQKTYNPDTLQAGVFRKERVDFTVNGAIVDTAFAMFNQSYDYFFNTGINAWDSTANDSILVRYFSSSTEPFKVIQEQILWPAPNGTLIGGNLDPNFIADTILFNGRDSMYVIPDDASLWIDRNAFINGTYPVDPPSIGVATLDGVDAFGQPYATNLFDPGVQGSADTLTSKPIYLKTKPNNQGTYNNSDSIYLSFFYQPQGIGERPSADDFLILECYQPTLDTWQEVWTAPGSDVKPFEQVMIKLSDTLYFQDGFQFRFRNIATLTGNLDHWHIDYVRLNNARTKGDTLLDDVAFRYSPPSLLTNYHAVPWSHYKATPGGFMKTETSTPVKNNSSTAKLVNFSLQVEEDGLSISTSPNAVVPNFAPVSEISQTFDLNAFQFPTADPAIEKGFGVKYISNTTPDINRNNDTAFYYQQFQQHYAYDDGSAERAYYGESQGFQVAYRFDIPVTDTLRAVQMYLPILWESTTNRPFRIMVWKSLDNGGILYEGGAEFPFHTGGRDLFTRYELDEPVEVSGTFFVGYQHIGSGAIYVGYDRNTDKSENLFYNSGNGWLNTLFDGSLMLRPDFGSTFNPHPVSASTLNADDLEISMYPNPANDLVRFKFGGSESITVEVFDISGRSMTTSSFIGTGELALDGFPAGIYLVRLSSQKGINTFKRLIVL